VSQPSRLRSITIHGYRPFRDFSARLGPLEVIVGANGSGKSSLFEFLRLLRDAAYQDFPPEILSGSIGQQIFHRPGPDKLSWDIEVDLHQRETISYQGELLGPVGRTKVSFEKVETSRPLDARFDRPFLFLQVRGSTGTVYDRDAGGLTRLEQPIELRRVNQLALSAMTNPNLTVLYNLRVHDDDRA
jgi:predicted ATPase